MNSDLIISATASVTPFGVGQPWRNIDLDASALEATPIANCYGPSVCSAKVPSYDARQLLGVRSVSQFDRLTLHISVAIEYLLQNLGLANDSERARQVKDERVSLVLGSSGPIQSILDIDLQTIEEPRYVQPSLVPNVVFNVPASYAAIGRSIRGSCITLTDGASSSLKALALAQAQIECGRIDLALCGGAEEATPAYALYVQAQCARFDKPVPALFEGAAMFALESASQAKRFQRRALAKVHGCAQAFASDDPMAALAQSLARLRAQWPSLMREVSHVYADAAIEFERVGLRGFSLHDLSAQLGHLGAMPACLAVQDITSSSAILAGELVLIVQAEADGSAAAALMQKY